MALQGRQEDDSCARGPARGFLRDSVSRRKRGNSREKATKPIKAQSALIALLIFDLRARSLVYRFGRSLGARRRGILCFRGSTNAGAS